VLDLMKERGLGDRLLTGGGIVPPEDMQTLADQGVGRLFGPGSSTQAIVEYVREWFASKYGADSLTPLPEPRAVQPPAVAGSEPVRRASPRAAAHRTATARRTAPARAATVARSSRTTATASSSRRTKAAAKPRTTARRSSGSAARARSSKAARRR
jgi:hypothetical protein